MMRSLKRKRCTACRRRRALSKFYRNRARRDGRTARCAECEREACNRNRWARIDHYRAVERKRAARRRARIGRSYYRANRSRFAKWQREWRQRNAEKAKAHSKLRHALDACKVKKGPCEVCGTRKDVEGHHDDYSKPLKVRWLCHVHHRKLHRKPTAARAARR